MWTDIGINLQMRKKSFGYC